MCMRLNRVGTTTESLSISAPLRLHMSHRSFQDTDGPI